MQLLRKLLHPQVHDDVYSICDHITQRWCVTDGLGHLEMHTAQPDRYNKIYNRDNPSDRCGIQPLDNSHQMIYYVLQEEVLLSVVLSVSIHWETQEPYPYHSE